MNKTTYPEEITLRELKGQIDDFIRQYVYDEDEPLSTILEIRDDPREPGAYQVLIYNGHGGRWWANGVSPDTVVSLNYWRLVAQLKDEIKEQHDIIQSLRELNEEFMSAPLEMQAKLDECKAELFTEQAYASSLEAKLGENTDED